MPGIGTIVNALAIVVGGALGLLFKKEIPDRFQNIIFTATGLMALLVGISGVVTASVTAANDGTLNSQYGLVLVLSLVLGGIVGELLRIDRAFEKAGDFIKRCFASAGTQNSRVGEGFAQATILFCSGAMAIVGSMEDVTGNHSILYTKAMMDGITALIFATVFGFGVIFSSVSVLLYQGAISLLSAFVLPYIDPVIISQISMAGSAILILIAFSLWEIKKFNVANLIPAAFMPVLLSFLPL